MAPAPTSLFVAASALLGSAAGLRARAVQESEKACGADDVNFAKITANSCGINWIISGRNRQNLSMASEVGEQPGCWKMRAYNTDKFLSSTLYQNERDGRCIIGVSGYHGLLAGYIRGGISVVSPPRTWNVCGAEMFAPYVRLFRHHTKLGNWSKIINFIAGPDSSCKGELALTAESMGGASGEMLAYCANAGRLHELQDASLPNFTLQTLYTFGSQASARQPLTNRFREDGCFKGKRIFFSLDALSHVNLVFNMKHARMDAVEIWQGKPVAVKVYECKSKTAVNDNMHKKPAPLKNLTMNTKSHDLVQHSVDDYASVMEMMHSAGLDAIFDEPPVSDHPPESVAGKYLSMMSEQKHF